MMVRSVQVPASNSVLLPQVARLFRIFSLMFIEELNSTTSPEPGPVWKGEICMTMMMKETETKKMSKWFIIGLVLLMCALVAPAMAAENQIDLLEDNSHFHCGAGETGANITQGPGPAGTGQFDPFLTTQTNNPISQGYNSAWYEVSGKDHQPQFDENIQGGPTGEQRTHALLLSQVPMFKVGDTIYRKFNLDANEKNSADKQYISLGKLSIYVGGNNAHNYEVGNAENTAAGSFIAGDTPIPMLVWDLDQECNDGQSGAFVVLDYDLEPGSGVSDMSVYIPQIEFEEYGCYYGAQECNNWVYMYTLFGVPSDTTIGIPPSADLEQDAGFEEWGVELAPIPPDLAITKVDSPDPVIVGNTVTYTITATNNGPSDVIGATVSDDFPVGLTDISWSCTVTAPDTCSPSSGTSDIAATVNLLSGHSATFTVTATVTEAAGCEITNTAIISAPAGIIDPNLANNQATAVTDVNAAAALTVVKTETSTGPYVPGDEITYSYLITNSGASTVTGITAVDDKVGSITLSATTLAKDATATGTGSYTVVEADECSVTNNVDVSGTDICEATVSADDDLTIATTSGAALTVVKTETSTGPYVPGDEITYSYLITNSGASTVTGITAVDDKVGSITLSATTLAKDATATGTGSYTVVEADECSVTNNVDVSGTDICEATVSADDDLTIATTSGAALTVVKTETSTGPYVPGDEITYSYLITNSGASTVTGITAVDDKVGSITLSATTLAKDATATGTGSYTVVEADECSVTNNVDVSGTDICEATVSADDDLTIATTSGAALTVVKTETSTGPYVPGDEITYSYLITNSGASTVTGITAVDDKVGSITLSATTLAKDATATGTGSYTVVEADECSVTNNVDVSGTDICEATVSADDDLTIATTSGAALTVVKTETSTGPYVPGDEITYSYLITNSGASTVTGITAVDDKVGSITLSATTLAKDATATGTGSYTVVEADECSVTNNVDVSGTDICEATVSADDDLTIATTSGAALTVVKTETSTGPYVPGDEITYSYLITNSGASTVTGITAVDDKVGSITLSATTLAKDATATGTGSYTVVEADECSVTNNVDVSGTDICEATVSADDDLTIATTSGAALTVVKTETSTGPYVPGDEITYSYLITNSGASTVTGITAVDDKVGSITLSATTLAKDATATGTGSYTVVEADECSVTNNVDVSGTDICEATVSADDDLTIATTSGAALTVVKTETSTGPYVPGDEITYSYLITNSGASTVTGITAVDDKVGSITLSATTLAKDATATGTGSYTVVEADECSVTNNVDVSGTDICEATVSADDDLTIATTSGAALTVVKTETSTGPYVPGDEITYSYLITNSGASTVTGITAVDDKVGSITLSATTLAKDATATGTGSYTVVEADECSVTNNVDVSGTDICEATVSADDDLTIATTSGAALTVVKTETSTGPYVPGDEITYSYLITNSGASTVTGITAVDDKVGSITLSATTLAKDATATGTGSYTVVEADECSVTNNVDVSGTDICEATVSADDDLTIATTSGAALTVVKTETSTGPYVPGDEITYSYLITNSGASTVTGITAVDDKVGSITLSATTLAKDATATGTGSYTVVEADECSVTNNVDVSGTDICEATVSADDDLTIATTSGAALTVVKTETSTGPYVPGDEITYSYLITNSGASTVTGITAVDDKVGSITLSATTLAKDATATGTGSYTVVEADECSVTNNVDVSGTDICEATVSADDDLTIATTSGAALTVVKTETSTGPYVPGDEITYSYLITNSGASTVTGITAVDDKVGSITLSATTLAKDATATGTGSYTVVEADECSVTNNVDVSGTDICEATVSADDDLTIATTSGAALTVVKTETSTGPYVPGDEITYSYLITNSGASTVTGITAVDDKVGSITLSATTLAKDATATEPAVTPWWKVTNVQLRTTLM